MPKCKKVKNPCKICLRTVTQKTGLQCKGACKVWIHYACLNYTPGKIKDIKAGIIKVTCPCPDCKSSLPREFRTDEPFSCSNLQCPANSPPNCGSNTCPVNNDGPDKMNQTSAINTKCPLGKCGTDCKKNSHPHSSDSPPIAEPCATNSPSNEGIGIQNSSSSSLLDQAPGDFVRDPMDGLPSLGALEQMCNTVGQLANQINALMNKMRQVVEERNAGCKRGCCPQKGPRSMCPKPCFCPGNPGRK